MVVLIGLSVLSLWFAFAGAPQGAPPTQAGEIQKRVEDLALSRAEELAMRVRGTTLGRLSPEADRAVLRWELAVREWKGERGAGAAPLLAEGVLFDCLGRLEGVRTTLLRGEQARPYFADLAAARPGRAAKAFEAALRLDPGLVEAQFRLARIRAPRDSKALQVLEQLAASATLVPIGYLAALSRAELSRDRGDTATAIRWYDQALSLFSGSTAATIALGSLRPNTAVSLAERDRADPHYSYPCTILSAHVAAGLGERLQRLVAK